MNPVHTLPFYLGYIHFNTSLPPTSTISKWYVTFSFHNQHFVLIFHLYQTLYTTIQFHSPLFHDTNHIWRRVQITNLIIMSFCPVFSCFSYLLERYIPLSTLKMCYGLLRYEAVWFCRQVPTFLRNLLPTLKMDAASSSKTLVHFYQTTRNHIQRAQIQPLTTLKISNLTLYLYTKEPIYMHNKCRRQWTTSARLYMLCGLLRCVWVSWGSCSGPTVRGNWSLASVPAIPSMADSSLYSLSIQLPTTTHSTIHMQAETTKNVYPRVMKS